MTTVPALCSFLNGALGLKAGTAESFANNLRAAGLLSKSSGGRGNRGGAEATSSDAAVLLLALLATDKATAAVDAVERFGIFSFAGLVFRHVTEEKDWSFRASPDTESAPWTDVFRKILLLVLVDLLNARRSGVKSPPGTGAVDIALHSLSPAESCWVSIGWSLSVDHGAGSVTAVWKPDAEPTDPQAPPSVVRSVAVPATLLDDVARFLGPLAADTAFTEAAQ